MNRTEIAAIIENNLVVIRSTYNIVLRRMETGLKRQSTLYERLDMAEDVANGFAEHFNVDDPKFAEQIYCYLRDNMVTAQAMPGKELLQ